jgi:exodeoxyribonuclease-5
MPKLTWSPQQDKALSSINEWYKSGQQVLLLDGYAGTGKTTLARHFAEAINQQTLFCAFTGKAASVLRKMGCNNASTLHSLLYSVSQRSLDRVEELEAELSKMSEDDVRWELTNELLYEARREANRPAFTLNPESPIREAGLVVLDESSMIDSRLAEDLESFGTKILVMGDSAQLPPVKGVGYYSQRPPDIRLTEIHRQARDNPILQFATLARQGVQIPFTDLGAARKVAKRGSLDALGDIYLSGAQLIIGTNVKRRKLNQFVRRHLGHEGLYPCADELLVMLRNNKDAGVLNGVQCRSLEPAFEMEIEIGQPSLSLPIMYEGTALRDFAVDPIPFLMYDINQNHSALESQLSHRDRLWMNPMDYGYAMTAHKAQGSQWERVVVCDDQFGFDKSTRDKWLYTAITRAQEEVIIVA